MRKLEDIQLYEQQMFRSFEGRNGALWVKMGSRHNYNEYTNGNNKRHNLSSLCRTKIKKDN